MSLDVTKILKDLRNQAIATYTQLLDKDNLVKT